MMTSYFGVPSLHLLHTFDTAHEGMLATKWASTALALKVQIQINATIIENK